MQKYDVIERGIKENDIGLLREAIGSIIYTCRDFSDGEFDELIKYVEAKGIKLKDDMIIGDPIISSKKDKFIEEDFVRAIFNLKNNFCDERIADVKKIGKALYGNKQKVEETEVYNNQETRTKVQEKPKIQKNRGTTPNQMSHQQEKKSKKMIWLVAILVVVVALILIMKK